MKWNDAEKVGCQKKKHLEIIIHAFLREVNEYGCPQNPLNLFKNKYSGRGGLITRKLEYFSWPWLHFRGD